MSFLSLVRLDLPSWGAGPGPGLEISYSVIDGRVTHQSSLKIMETSKGITIKIRPSEMRRRALAANFDRALIELKDFAATWKEMEALPGQVAIFLAMLLPRIVDWEDASSKVLGMVSALTSSVLLSDYPERAQVIASSLNTLFFNERQKHSPWCLILSEMFLGLSGWALCDECVSIAFEPVSDLCRTPRCVSSHGGCVLDDPTRYAVHWTNQDRMRLASSLSGLKHFLNDPDFEKSLVITCKTLHTAFLNDLVRHSCLL